MLKRRQDIQVQTEIDMDELATVQVKKKLGRKDWIIPSLGRPRRTPVMLLQIKIRAAQAGGSFPWRRRRRRRGGGICVRRGGAVVLCSRVFVFL
jgi:hypothetical protein